MHGKPQSKRARRNQSSHGAVIDGATQLLVRTAVPIKGRRPFFISKESAEFTRQALIMEKRNSILEKRSQRQSHMDAEIQGGILGYISRYGGFAE